MYSNVEFVKESEFSSDLLHLIQSADSSFIAFHVDDMIFYRSFNVENALKLMADAQHRLFALFPKLNEKISYCHPSSSLAPTPTFLTKLKFKKFRVWMPMKEQSDWNYLWDLCGTIYAKKDVLTIYRGIESKFTVKGLSSPNRFEVSGNKLVHLVYPGSAMKMFAACCGKAVMSVITVNRVQNDYDVPIYDDAQKSTDELLQYFVNERQLDLQRYSSLTFNSVHIKEVLLLPQRGKRRTKRRDIVVEQGEIEVDSPDFDEKEVEEWKRWLIAVSEQEIKRDKLD